jgi:hypothetical protein
MPTVAVDSDVDRLVNALRPEETCALVGVAASATIVEIAVEKITPSEVTLERLVLSSVAPEGRSKPPHPLRSWSRGRSK